MMLFPNQAKGGVAVRSRYFLWEHARKHFPNVIRYPLRFLRSDGSIFELVFIRGILDWDLAEQLIPSSRDQCGNDEENSHHNCPQFPSAGSSDFKTTHNLVHRTFLVTQ